MYHIHQTFAVYNAHFFAQVFEGQIGLCIIHGYNTPVYKKYKSVGVQLHMEVHCTWQNMVYHWDHDRNCIESIDCFG